MTPVRRSTTRATDRSSRPGCASPPGTSGVATDRGRHACPVIVENLRAIDADIVALQEVWEDDTRNQARELADALGYTEPVYAANLERRRRALRERGARALADHSPRRARAPPARRVRRGRRRRRGAPLRVRGGRRPTRAGPGVLRAHLSWQWDHSAIRQEQTRAIARFLTTTRPRPFPPCSAVTSMRSSRATSCACSPGGRRRRCPGVVLRDAWEAAEPHRAPATRGRTPIRSRPPASISTGASTTCMVGPPKLGGVGHVLAARRCRRPHHRRHVGLRPPRGRRRAAVLMVERRTCSTTRCGTRSAGPHAHLAESIAARAPLPDRGRAVRRGRHVRRRRVGRSRRRPTRQPTPSPRCSSVPRPSTRLPGGTIAFGGAGRQMVLDDARARARPIGTRPLAAADVDADARPRRAHAARVRSAPAPSSSAATTACSTANGSWRWRVSGSACRGSPR